MDADGHVNRRPARASRSHERRVGGLVLAKGVDIVASDVGTAQSGNGARIEPAG